MAIEILDSGTVKVLALITFAVADELPTVVGRGVQSFEGNGGAVDIVPVDPLPEGAVIFVSPVNIGDGRLMLVSLDANEPGDNGEIELVQLDLAGAQLDAVGTWSLLVLYPSAMGAVAGTLTGGPV